MKYSTVELLKGSRLIDADLLREWSKEMSELRAEIAKMDEAGNQGFIKLLQEIEALPDNWSPTDQELKGLISGKGKFAWDYDKAVKRLDWLSNNPPAEASELTIFLETVNASQVSDADIKASGVEIHYSGLGKYAVRAAREER